MLDTFLLLISVLTSYVTSVYAAARKFSQSVSVSLQAAVAEPGANAAVVVSMEASYFFLLSLDNPQI